jgi:hypothetical protein
MSRFVHHRADGELFDQLVDKEVDQFLKMLVGSPSREKEQDEDY